MDLDLTEIQTKLEDTLLKYVRYDIRLWESTIMSKSPFSLKHLDSTGWKFSWYAPRETHKWDVEDLLMDGDYVYIGPKDPGVKLITIKKNRPKLNINWEKKTISYKGNVDEFITWGDD